MKINQVLMESAGSTVAFAFGRFNPAHQGHIEVWRAVEDAGANWFVGTNPNTIGPNDPLTFEQKSAWMAEIYPPISGHIVAQTSVLTLAAYIFKKTRKNERATVAYITDATDWAWSGKLLNQYNGVEGSHGYYKFAEITHVPSPRVSSATALRDAARANDRVAFYQASGTDPKSTVDGLTYFDTVKQAVEKYPLPVKRVKKVKEQGVAEGSDSNLSYQGNCTEDDVIEHIFGDATRFAQAVEEYGDEFVLDDLVVKYDPETDVHSFYYKKQGVAENQGDSLKFDALEKLIAIKQQIQQQLQQKQEANIAAWKQDFEKNTVQKAKQQLSTTLQTTPVAQAGEKYNVLKDRLVQLNVAIQKHKELNNLIDKIKKEYPVVADRVDSYYESILPYAKAGAKDNYKSLIAKLNSINVELRTKFPGAVKDKQSVTEANINQQISLWHPETKTYRGSVNKIPTSDYAGHDDITKNYRRVNKFKHSEILPNLNYNVSLGGNDDSIEKVEQNITREKIKNLINDQLHLLNSREKEVLYHRFWNDLTLDATAQKMSLSKERIRQIEARAFRILRNPDSVQKLRPSIDAMMGEDITEADSPTVAHTAKNLENPPKIMQHRAKRDIQRDQQWWDTQITGRDTDYDEWDEPKKTDKLKRSVKENASRMISAHDKNGFITVIIQAPDGSKKAITNDNPTYINQWLMRYDLKLPPNITNKFKQFSLNEFAPSDDSHGDEKSYLLQLADDLFQAIYIAKNKTAVQAVKEKIAATGGNVKIVWNNNGSFNVVMYHPVHFKQGHLVSLVGDSDSQRMGEGTDYPYNINRRSTANIRSTANSRLSPELRHVPVPVDMSHPEWKEPLWNFQEISDKLGIGTDTLRAYMRHYPGFPVKVQGVKSSYGSKTYYSQRDVKRWVNANDIRNIIKSKQGVKESTNVQGPVEAWGYRYNERDQRVMWRLNFDSEEAARKWADSKNATVVEVRPVKQLAEDEQQTVAKTWDQMTPEEKSSGVKGRTLWNEKTQRYYTVFDVPVNNKEVEEDASLATMRNYFAGDKSPYNPNAKDKRF
jgi:RNA polymerase sigma factor (sigma-70 family)